jgi:hypothetical protein
MSYRPLRFSFHTASVPPSGVWSSSVPTWTPGLLKLATPSAGNCVAPTGSKRCVKISSSKLR